MASQLDVAQNVLVTCVFHLQYSFTAHDEHNFQLLAQLIAMPFQCGVKLSFVERDSCF